MNLIITAIAFVKGNRWAQIAGIAMVGAISFLLWLSIHDRKVIEAHDTKVNQKAAEQAQEAAKGADEKQELRNDAFEKSNEGLANASDPAAYLRRLRQNQCAANPAACR